VEFPIFRKYNNNKSYFRIDNASSLTEVQRIGKYYVIHTLEAKILPERIMIDDLINLMSVGVEKVAREEYDLFLEYCRNELVERNV